MPAAISFFAHDEEVGDLASGAVADLLRYRIALRRQLGAHELRTQRLDNAPRVVVEVLGDGEHLHLHWREPRGEGTAEVLEQKRDEALVGAEGRPVYAVRDVLGSVVTDVGQPQARGHRKVELHRG